MLKRSGRHCALITEISRGFPSRVDWVFHSDEHCIHQYTAYVLLFCNDRIDVCDLRRLTLTLDNMVSLPPSFYSFVSVTVVCKMKPHCRRLPDSCHSQLQNDGSRAVAMGGSRPLRRTRPCTLVRFFATTSTTRPESSRVVAVLKDRPRLAPMNERDTYIVMQIRS